MKKVASNHVGDLVDEREALPYHEFSCGKSLIDASSGDRKRRKLIRGGNAAELTPADETADGSGGAHCRASLVGRWHDITGGGGVVASRRRVSRGLVVLASVAVAGCTAGSISRNAGGEVASIAMTPSATMATTSGRLTVSGHLLQGLEGEMRQAFGTHSVFVRWHKDNNSVVFSRHFLSVPGSPQYNYVFRHPTTNGLRLTAHAPKAPYAGNGYFEPVAVGKRYVVCADGHYLRRRDSAYGLSLTCRVGK
jgi:hypothetical protein